MLGWSEIESLRRDDRLTISVGPAAYVNVREQPEPMVSHGYEHLGVILPSAAALRQLWVELDAEPLHEELEELSTNRDGEGSFRFRYLLPLAVEAQYFAQLVRLRPPQTSEAASAAQAAAGAASEGGSFART